MKILATGISLLNFRLEAEDSLSQLHKCEKSIYESESDFK